MPIREFVGEVIGRVVVEFALYGLSYWSGAIVLKTVSGGKLRLAPLSTINEKDRARKRRGKGRSLKAEWVCVVGISVWVLVGVGIYFATRPGEA